MEKNEKYESKAHEKKESKVAEKKEHMAKKMKVRVGHYNKEKGEYELNK